MGMHRQRKIAMNQVHLAGVHVIVDQRLIGGLEELLACGALKVAVNSMVIGASLEPNALWVSTSVIPEA
jgi:hypothetical protein